MQGGILYVKINKITKKFYINEDYEMLNLNRLIINNINTIDTGVKELIPHDESLSQKYPEYCI